MKIKNGKIFFTYDGREYELGNQCKDCKNLHDVNGELVCGIVFSQPLWKDHDCNMSFGFANNEKMINELIEWKKCTN